MIASGRNRYMLETTEQGVALAEFTEDVIKGLSMDTKTLPSKYFYDAKGDKLFQDIMACDEYYLTGCEMEIFTEQLPNIAKALIADGTPFELIELGPGNCAKSKHLLQRLMESSVNFTYIPIDISEEIIDA